MVFNPGLKIGQILKNADRVFTMIGTKKMGYEFCMEKERLEFL